MTAKKSKGLTYKDSGVDIAAGDRMVKRIKRLCRSTYGPAVLTGIGGFAGAFQIDGQLGLLGKRLRSPVLVACTDGVGTKLRVALAVGKHDTVGIDLVAMSVNDLVVTGATPLFFLDYFVTGKLDPQVGEQVVKGIVNGCKKARVALLGGETAEHPGCMPDDEYDLAGFAVGLVEKHKIIDGSRVEAGDVILGLASTGIHSNGFSLARKVLLEMSGWDVNSRVAEFGRTVGEELLEPTRIYVDALFKVFGEYRVKKVVKALAHVTGGGLVDNVPRVLPSGLAARIHRDAWTVPPVFEVIARIGEIEEPEMLHTFNMGVGMVLVCPEYYSQAIARRLRRLRIPTWRIGEVVERQKDAVEFV
ncbi:MAG: phosphoribosylformylglycinamidine cyclo-ligase [Planctomycetota bacterium]